MVYLQFTKWPKHTVNFNSTKEAIGQLKLEAAKGPFGHRAKQPPILFENSAVWRKLLILIKYF